MRDTLFSQAGSPVKFEFNDQVAEVFDDMLVRSVPCYRQVITMIGRILEQYLAPVDTIYDLGCSTGTAILELARRLDAPGRRFIGVDNSAAMLAKARRKAAMYTGETNVAFLEKDITGLAVDGAGAVILNYTLQFLQPGVRAGFIKKIHDALRPGGVLIISEKIVAPETAMNRVFLECYLGFKREQGYSELEIARKREALENVLVPLTAADNRALLLQAGFSATETFFQWFNFISLLAVKKEGRLPAPVDDAAASLPG